MATTLVITAWTPSKRSMPKGETPATYAGTAMPASRVTDAIEQLIWQKTTKPSGKAAAEPQEDEEINESDSSQFAEAKAAKPKPVPKPKPAVRAKPVAKPKAAAKPPKATNDVPAEPEVENYF